MICADRLSVDIQGTLFDAAISFFPFIPFCASVGFPKRTGKATYALLNLSRNLRRRTARCSEFK